MQTKQNTLISGQDENTSANIGPYEDEKLTLEEQDIEEDHKNLGGKSSNIRSRIKEGLSRLIPQTGLFGSESLLSLREIWFSNQKFAAGIPISNIKYNNPGFQNNKPFYLFHDQLNYRLAKYFAKSKSIENNIDMFLSKLSITPMTEKFFYQNADKWSENFLEISWGIPNDKWIKYQFEHQSSVAWMAE